jgi:hypothetical protein
VESGSGENRIGQRRILVDDIDEDVLQQLQVTVRIRVLNANHAQRRYSDRAGGGSRGLPGIRAARAITEMSAGSAECHDTTCGPDEIAPANHHR